MGLFVKIPVLLVSILSFFNFSTKAEFARDLTDVLSSEPSNSKCDESAIFAKPPCCGIAQQLSSNRIFGGSKAESGEFPWIVIIYFPVIDGFSDFGGGSLINSRWVLTAGHNVNDVKNPADLAVSLGELCRTDDTAVCAPHAEKFLVDKIIVHEKFSFGTNDIALLRLANAVTFNDFISPICLPLNATKLPNYADKMAVIAGWGVTESGGPSDVLLKTTLKVWDAVNCQKPARNSSLVICASGVKGTGVCIGDSGGPLVLQVENDGQKSYYQIGLLSFGAKACRSPSVYTNVAAYMQWINTKILKNQ